MGRRRKKQLGRILVSNRLITEDELKELLQRQKAEPGMRLGSVARASGKVSDVEILKALSQQHGVPGIDLTQVVVPLANLRLIPAEIAKQQQIFPIVVRDDRIFLAMSDPGDSRVIEEIEFVTGRKVLPYVAVQESLVGVIEEAYRIHLRGAELYIGENAPPDYLESLGLRDTEPPPIPFAQEGSGVIVDRKEVFGNVDLSSDDGTIVPESGPHARPTSEKPRILVVDDEGEIRRMLRRVLEEKGYEVLEAAQGHEALGLVREHVPDLIILDAMLPEVHGFDLCRRVKGSRRYGNIPIIMISAVYRGWRVAEDLRQSYGVAAFIEKPFRIEDVLNSIEAALAGKAPREPADELSVSARECLHRGIDAYKSGEIEVAISHMREGLEIDPLSFQLHYHLGLLYGRSEDIFEAIHQLETAVDLQPRSFSALRNLAVLYQSAGFRHKSIEMWERALTNAPDDDTRRGIKDHLVNLL